MTKFNCILVMILLTVYSDIGFSQNTNVTTKDSVVWQYFNAKQYEGDKRKYTEDDLYPPYVLKGQANDSIVAQYLRLLRNEIYARHGKGFKDKTLQSFFDKLQWYIKVGVEPTLNDVEEKNVAIVLQKEHPKIDGVVENSAVMTGPAGVDTLPEKYLKKIIIDARWGNGLGEFGMSDEAAGMAPRGYAIDIDDNIYIIDNCNHRIQKYDNSGKFILAFKVESKDGAWFLNRIVIDKTGKIYLRNDTANEISSILQYDKGGQFQKSIKYGEASKTLKGDERTNELRRQFEQINKNMDEIGNEVKLSISAITDIPLFRGLKKKENGWYGGEKNFHIWVSNIHRDSKNNTYHEVVKRYDREDGTIEVKIDLYKYNSLGRVLAIIPIVSDRAIDYDFADMPEQLYRFDNETVYMLYWSSKIGVQVLKWRNTQ